MKKITLLVTLLLTQFAFAQWDGNFPGDGTFPWQGDSSVFVTDSMIIIGGDTILISTNPTDGENPWDNDNPGGGNDNDNPWDNDMPFGDSIIVINDSTFVVNGDTISLSDIDWDNDWGNDDNDNPWGGNDDWDVDFPFEDSIFVIIDSIFVINGDTISIGDIDWDNDWGNNDNPWDDSTDVENPWEEEIEVINDSTIVVNGDTISIIDIDFGTGWGDNNNPWDDSTDVENPWEEEIEVINDSTIVINGDTITFPGEGGGFPGDGEWPWDDSTDVEEAMIADCNGVEGPANWINDGYCDDGTWGSDFNCEEFDFDGGDCEGIGEGENPWDDSTDVENPWEDEFEVINDSTIVINGDTITFPGGGNGFPGDGENPWDDSTDVENPWEDEFEVINDSTIVINGDTITFPGGGSGFPGDGENPWDDSTDVDCPWEDGFPGGSGTDDFDEDTFEEMMEIIEGFDMADDELVLILEQTDVILSILDENGFEFTPTEIDGYLVFGPFSLEDLYTIIMENMEGFEIGWGLFRPAGGTVVAEGVITSTNENINNMFNVSMLSLYEADAALEVYKTTYYNLLGKEVKDANNGVFIKVMQTNKGEISTKVYIAK